MTDVPNQPPPRVAAGHEVPADQWEEVVRNAAKFRNDMKWREPTEGDVAPLTGNGGDEPRRLVRRLAAVLDWTARGSASGKYFGVSGIPTQLLVLHSAECPLQAGYAQSLTNWALTPLSAGGPQASWHRFVDPGVRLRMIDDNLGAWHASEANSLSIGWEQAGYARFTRAEWLTPAGLLQLDALAFDMAEVAKRDGIPARWLTNAEVRAALDSGNRSIKGFCTHRQIDPESRTDPGDGYPYDLLMNAIKKYMTPAAPPPPPAPVKDEFDMAKLTDLEAIVKKYGWWYKGANAKDAFYHLVNAPRNVWGTTINRMVNGKLQKISAIQELADAKTLGIRNETAIKELSNKLDAVLAAVKANAPAPGPAAVPMSSARAVLEDPLAEDKDE